MSFSGVKKQTSINENGISKNTLSKSEENLKNIISDLIIEIQKKNNIFNNKVTTII
jgi:hypothetical protein